MHRDLNAMRTADFDLLVVGAGIHGACVAWDAVLRGLRVGVIDRDDFGAGTSANSLRIVHGGLRYLARADFARMRESVRERSALLRIAPHLVRPLGVLIATRGRGAQSRSAMRAALALNDVLTFRRNRGTGPGQSIPPGRVVSRAEVKRLFAPLDQAGMTGGAIWYDGQMVHPERLTFAFLAGAAGGGASLANYLRADAILVEGDRVQGVRATDTVTGEALEIRAQCVLGAMGPWTGELGGGSRPQAFALNVILNRRLADVAVGVRALSTAEQDPVIGGGRYLFAVPHGASTLLGTWYAIAGDAVAGSADDSALIERGVRSLIAEFNAACPAARISAGDVLRAQWGRLPLKGRLEPGRPDSLADRPRVFHHADQGGPRGLVTLDGVKYTTARLVAERAVDLVFSVLGRPGVPCRTTHTPLPDTRVPASDPEAAIRLAVRSEMAVHLADVVLRRTDLGAPPGPTREVVETAGRTAGGELGWNVATQEAEIEDVMRRTTAGARELEPAR
ncbi:MAG: FAD-dependent oxidoreductase [Gemmatimonadales bacterium]|nr:FAD-dependent oxidoreductase [Gemmatimonadales bacterium]